MSHRRSRRFVAFVPLLVLVCLLAATAPDRVLAGGNWNDGQVAWKGYEEGLALAKKEGKPVCLIFYTDWCPHCTNYSRVFHDAEVVETAKKFVMIRLNKDKNAELSGRYAPDGQYIPRTYFLSPAGELWKDVHAPRSNYVFFYDESRPAGVLAGMRAALAKHDAH